VKRERRVCLLTGAGGLLGNTFCRLYRSEYAIAAVYRSRPPDVPSQHQSWVDPLDPSATLEDPDHAVFTIQADLSEDRQIPRVVELTLARFGRIDLLVHAAADTAFLGSMLTHDLRRDRIRAQIAVNVEVPLALSAAVARVFWRDRVAENRARGRSVVHLSSLSGREVFPGSGQSVYAATKAALDMVGRHMAAELATIGVRSNVIAPARFPAAVPTECVAEMIARLDSTRVTGNIVVLDQRGERWTS